MSEKACPMCRVITRESICPKCKTVSLSDDFTGLIIVFDPQGSTIAKTMNITEKGRYALKVR